MSYLGIPRRSTCLTTIVIAALAAWSHQAVGGGVAVLKQQSFYDDASAKPVIYSQIIDLQGPYIRIVSGQKDLHIERSTLAGYVEVLKELPATITNDAECAPLKSSLSSLVAFSTKYPKSAPLLQPQIKSLTEYLGMLDSGQVRYEGVWMTKIDHLKIQAKEQAAQGMARRQKDEDEAYAKRQATKGLVLHEGNWLPINDPALVKVEEDFDLGAEISPIQKPDVESAKLAVTNLQALASRQKGAAKVRTERLLSLIKNLFTADFRVSEQIKAGPIDELEATKQDQNAKNWLIPTAFGTVNEVAARQSEMKAAEIRERSVKQLANRRNELLVQLQEADSITHDFHKLQEFGVVVALANSIRVINERSMPSKVFTPSFPESALNEIRELLRNRNEWLVTARNAEIAENFEEAIRFYGKSRDLEGKKRCALRLARNLEDGKVIGSAIEYYEIAGDFTKAANLRMHNPDLRMESFRKLDAENLFSKIAPCCVRVYNGNGMGSGFFFKRGGYLLTNRHVVDSPGSITVKLDDGRTFEATPVVKSADLDLAIIRVSMDGHGLVTFRTGEEIKIGTPVALIGYPEVDLPTATMNSGRVSNTNRTFYSNTVYQLDVSANHGNSGGPVVDEAGRLVGILTFGLNDSDKDRFNFAITAEAVLGFVQKELHE